VRFPLAVAALAAVVVVGWQAFPRQDGAEPPAPPTTSPTLSTQSPPDIGVLGHEDDYSAPAEELVEHADHLDFDRLPPDTRREIEAELARRDAIATELWAVYGPSLTGDPSTERPAAVQVLGAYELGYVLMTARAERLASAVAQAGGLDEALALPATGADHDDVTAVLDGDCVTVAFSQDPFDRAFGARVGPAGSGDLSERIARRVTVGAAGAPTCGGAPPAFSTSAVTALAALDS
jgi:hypothetical protein